MIHSSIDRIIEAINDGGEHPSGCGLQKLSRSYAMQGHAAMPC
jgi:hypothetical protein